MFDYNPPFKLHDSVPIMWNGVSAVLGFSCSIDWNFLCSYHQWLTHGLAFTIYIYYILYFSVDTAQTATCRAKIQKILPLIWHTVATYM